MSQFTNSIEYTDTNGSQVVLDGVINSSTVDASTLSVASAQEAQHAVNADNATNANHATSADSATNVTTNINGKAISSIFESDGITVKTASDAKLSQAWFQLVFLATSVSGGAGPSGNIYFNVLVTDKYKKDFEDYVSSTPHDLNDLVSFLGSRGLDGTYPVSGSFRESADSGWAVADKIVMYGQNGGNVWIISGYTSSGKMLSLMSTSHKGSVGNGSGIRDL